MGDCGLDCCHSWLSRYLKQWSMPVPIKKTWKEHCFCNEYTCLLSFFSQWFKCVILISFCTCDDVHITCETDYELSAMVINFRQQETNIPLTCIFIYTVQTKLVQCIPPPPPPNYFVGGGGGGEKKKEKKNKIRKQMCNLFRACLSFE